jgi:hypothetical protein
MPKKYTYLYVLQGNYGFGWEDLTAEEQSVKGSFKRIRQDKKAYIENEGGRYRIVERRVLNDVA